MLPDPTSDIDIGMAITCARVSAVPVARARRSVPRLFLNHHSASILRLLGSPKTIVRDRLDVWPDLSLIIHDSSTISPPDNINRSRVSILLGKLLARPKFACGKSFGSDAGAIPGANRTTAQFV